MCILYFRLDKQKIMELQANVGDLQNDVSNKQSFVEEVIVSVYMIIIIVSMSVHGVFTLSLSFDSYIRLTQLV